MPLQGFSVPLSPEGRTSLTPAPPWHYAGDLLVVDFDAEPAAVAAVLPPRLDPDPRAPGGCVAFFVAWQYASEGGEEFVDPARSQYNEFILLVNALYNGRPVHTCPYIYVDSDVAMARGWIQGWPKKFGQVRVYRSDFKPLKHTLSGSSERTLMKLVVDAVTAGLVAGSSANFASTSKSVATTRP